MVAVAARGARETVDGPSVVRKRLEVFAGEVLAAAVNRPVQLVNGGLYLRGLIEDGSRKSLEPLVARLSGEADYESLQQFLAVSSWDPTRVLKATAERVAPVIDVQAWVLDDTGFPKDGKHSPGVKRQYSGTLGKIGNCQIGVSVHAVGGKGTVPLGWALYLPEEWCEDPERRAKAKIPEEIEFQTKPELGVGLIEQAGGWDVPRCVSVLSKPVLRMCSRSTQTRASSHPRRYSLSRRARRRPAGHGPGCARIVSQSMSQSSSTGSPRRTCRPSRSVTAPTGSPSPHGSVFCGYAQSSAGNTAQRSSPGRSG